MVEYAKSEGVPLSVVEKAAVWLNEGGFDSDAVKQDVTEQTMASHQCSVAQHTASEALCRALIAFIEKTKGNELSFEGMAMHFEPSYLLQDALTLINIQRIHCKEYI